MKSQEEVMAEVMAKVVAKAYEDFRNMPTSSVAECLEIVDRPMTDGGAEYYICDPPFVFEEED